MTDEDPTKRPADEVDPDEFQTFDSFDPSIDPPERPDEQGPTRDGDTPEVRRGVPAGTVMSAVGVLAAAYNRR